MDRDQVIASVAGDLYATEKAIDGAITQATGQIEDAQIFVIAPPAVQGLGNGNGFKCREHRCCLNVLSRF